jgi:hypothetical protein
MVITAANAAEAPITTKGIATDNSRMAPTFHPRRSPLVDGFVAVGLPAVYSLFPGASLVAPPAVTILRNPSKHACMRHLRPFRASPGYFTPSKLLIENNDSCVIARPTTTVCPEPCIIGVLHRLPIGRVQVIAPEQICCLQKSLLALVFTLALAELPSESIFLGARLCLNVWLAFACLIFPVTA